MQSPLGILPKWTVALAFRCAFPTRWFIYHSVCSIRGEIVWSLAMWIFVCVHLFLYLCSLQANSGFYYVRANKRSQYLFTSLLYHSDLILTWDSHQQALVQLLSEHSSLFGLNVKVFKRDSEMFPGGFHFHQRHDFMKKMLKGETDTYIFHMSWTSKSQY